MHPLFLLPAILAGFFAGTFTKKKPTVTIAPLGLPVEAWESFVSVMAVYPKGHIDPRYKLGAFGMDARKLKDVGAMTTAVKGVYGTEDGVWMGSWAPGLTEAAFLGSMPVQYAVFVRSMKAAAPKVSKFVGVPVEGVGAGERCTLSGLLGVAHAAGEAGVESWVSEPAIRRRFKRTTDTFVRTNGIF